MNESAFEGLNLAEPPRNTMDGNKLGLYIGVGAGGANDLQSTSSQNLNRAFVSTPNSNLIYPSPLTRPATSSGGQGLANQGVVGR